MNENPDKPLRQRSFSGLLFFLTLALALRIIWIAAVPNQQVADFKMYDAMAASFYRGQGYTDVFGRPSAFKPPGYPLLLALIYHVFGESPFAAKVLQANLSTLLCLLVFLLSRRIFGERTAFIALILCAFHPSFIFSVSLLGTEIPFTCLVVSAVLILCKSKSISSTKQVDFLLAGLAFGAAALMRPMALLAPLPLGMWLLIDWQGWQKSSKALIVFCLAMTLPILPWTIRNYIHFQKFVPISTNGGCNLFYGHNPSGEIVWIPFDKLQKIPGFPSKEDWYRWDETRRSSYMRNRAIEYIKKNPLGLFTRMPQKFYLLMLSPDVPSLYWNIEGLPKSYEASKSKLSLLASLNRLFAYGVLILSLLGIISCRLSDKRSIFIYTLILVWILFHLVYWGKPRFRYPMVPFLTIFAALPLASLTASMKRLTD